MRGPGGEYELPVKLEGENRHTTSCKVLIENGDHDDIVPTTSVNDFKAEMDAAGIDWRFHNHARTPHGFALAPGVWASEYKEDADRRSTLSMLSLFAEVWPEFYQETVECNAAGTKLGQGVMVLADDGPRAKL